MTASVHCTTAHDADDENVDADVKRMAAAITQRGQSSTSCEDTQDNLITSTVTNPHSDLGTGITQRGRSTSFSQETQDISCTSGVTIQHGVNADDVQSSSENFKTRLLQLAKEISIAAHQKKVTGQDSGLKMHEASEAQTLSLKTFEEVKSVQQDKEHSNILFASTVHTKRHSYFGQSCTAVTEYTTGLAKHVKSSCEVDVNAGYGDAVGCNVVGGSDREQLKKSTMVKDHGGDGGVNPNMVKSDTKVAVESDESPIVVSSDTEDNASKKKKEDKTKKVTGDAKPSEKPIFHMIEGNWLQSKLDSIDHMGPLYLLGANFILDIELLGYPKGNIDAWDESIGKELRLPTIDDIAKWTRQKLWCTEVGIINPAPEVVEFNEPRYCRGVSWPQSYWAIIYAVEPEPIMYANERVICEEDLPKFYVCTTGG